jgi:hypothetical protein
VNKFKHLKIDIDGIFASMLLLKKKKYAALAVTEGPPGPDGVRSRLVSLFLRSPHNMWPLSLIAHRLFVVE